MSSSAGLQAGGGVDVRAAAGIRVEAVVRDDPHGPNLGTSRVISGTSGNLGRWQRDRGDRLDTRVGMCSGRGWVGA